ncbi:hypothetical protein LAZ67_X001773 [Cordylochernes scorpioides]|uniref:ribonuclease H n=1 Tax=Cordylochernes scorpioides TaxID=51811 RepID=A0ABY6LWW2_9ARAC|nr:hypothetical protein LAZ67_X001773 [Cordylochernes scorpioides]
MPHQPGIRQINSPKEHLTGNFIRNWVPNQRLTRPTPLNQAHNSNLLDIPINPKHITSYPPHRIHNKLTCFPHLPAKPHKHETQPELLKALGLQIIEENRSLFDIPIYTDGSQLETELSGSGIAIYKDKILEKISLSHPRHPSVYKSELSAIDTSIKDTKSPSKIIIYSDSRAAIYILQSCFSSQEPLFMSIANSVTVKWVPAHVGIPVNELADSLAKAGALGLPEARESTTQLEERDLLHTIKTQCWQDWKSNTAHDWYRAGGTSLPIEQQSLISRLKSGHLRKMTFQNGCKVFPLCTKCNSQPIFNEISVSGVFQTSRKTSLWSKASSGTRRLRNTLCARWTWESDNCLLSIVLLNAQSKTRTKIGPSIKNQLVGKLRQAVQEQYLDALLLKRDQGKCSNAFILNGRYFRFTDWRFIHRACLNLLPLNGSVEFGNRNKKCRRYGSANETLLHVLQHCKTYSTVWKRRHDAVLKHLRKALRVKGELRINQRIPNSSSPLRPDLVIIQKDTKKITMLRKAGYKVNLEAFLVGSLGGWDNKNERVLRMLEVSPRYAKLMRKLMFTYEIKWSRDIYVEHISGKRQYQ